MLVWPQSSDGPDPPFIDVDSAAFAAQSKSADDIIKSAKFPSANAPGPDNPAKTETDSRSSTVSHAVLGTVVTHDTCFLKETVHLKIKLDSSF